MTGFESKRKMAQAKVNDDDDTQVYADTLTIVYQRGFADGKAAANAMHELARLGQEIEQEPCIGKDPRCPCQDGDACHYKDCVGTKARPVAQPEQEPVAWYHDDFDTLELSRVQRVGWKPLYTTPPAAPVQDVNWKDMYEKEKRRSEMWVAKYEKDIGPLEYAVPVAQRSWVGLTDEDVNRESAMIASQMKLAFHAGMYVAQQILKERNNG